MSQSLFYEEYYLQCLCLNLFLFLTYMGITLDQAMTQDGSGGMTDVYLDSGTYLKSFYTVMMAPSCVTVRDMGEQHRRLHHRISWDHAVPKIISGSYRKDPDGS